MKKHLWVFWSVCGVLCALVLLFGFGIDLGLAQGPVPDTEQSGTGGTPPFRPPAYPKLPAGSAPDENSSLKAPGAPNVQFSYFYLPGAALQPRDSATGHDYSGAGCVYTVGGSDRILVAHMNIPDGSIIKYLRLFYLDTDATYNVLGYITRYDAGTATNDLISVSSSGSGGSGTALSSEITHTVDAFGYGYVLIGWPGASSSTVQVCGLRVAYYAPAFSFNFLPLMPR